MVLGNVLNDRYQIIQYIGGGGMANVYLGQDLILNREVAIKILRLEYADNQEFIERFNREAEAAISLSNEHIVSIYDVGQEDDIHYMVMEYIDGMTLKQYIQSQGHVPMEESVHIMLQLTNAVEHAHQNGIVHRDIKPQNILIDQSGHIKITDFGIARALSTTSLTKTNDVMGSVHYLSPEQARGGLATNKSDIYSLGIVLYELLTGRLPFSGESAVSIALKHMQTEPPFVRSFNPNIPQSLENVVLKSTVKNPLERYETVEELRQSLETVFDPSRLNEARYVPPVEEGEDTKAIPAINEEQSTHSVANSNQSETIVPGKQNGSDKRSKKWGIWITVGLFIVIAAIVLALFVLPGLFMPKDVTIPDVKETTYEDAVTELSNLDLDVERESVFSEEIDEGLVVRSEPNADSTVKEGSTVTLYTSLGQEKLEFPDYVGDEFNDVKRYLEANGYQEVIHYEQTSEQPEGQIINQIQPEPGQEIIPEETRVIFDISQGPPSTEIPSFTNWTLDEVQDYAGEHNLTLLTEEEHSEEFSEGRIIRQEPSPESELEEGDEVKVFVSEGPEPQPITETVSFTVEYDGSQTENNQNNNGEGSSNNGDQANQSNQENEEPQGQEVSIYIEDQDNSIEDIYEEDVIREDTTYEVDLTIAPDSTGEVLVIKEEEQVYQETIPYDSGESE
ncbi:Stk1 family PASTA domain-containing Ser/Thr kinase [Alkalibacillus almallahensis]|uniref:Stk1 family PASTA domain-containing Ser/Thr kinase n=1 Tax=Alkalibacillus almallahensis TaxID=1379154 RepID=UPI0014201812|nr:serine/threonine-protein kinase [Alkalibacillus almallahensis]